MASKKLKTFTLTSEGPYDRHTYIVHVNRGDPIHVEEYDVARALWFQLGGRGSTIEVVDK